jgi:hypothetical protein
MDHEGFVGLWLGRRLLRAAVGAVGIATIAGCTVASDDGGCGLWPTHIDNCIAKGGIGGFAVAFVSPTEATVQVGATVTFAGVSTGANNPVYQWQRSSDGGQTYADIAGASASSYTLAGAQLPDDGVFLRFTVRDSTGEQAQASALLHVSSMPPVVFQDGEFLAQDWSASAIANPAVGGPTHDEEQLGTGGNPDAYRRMTHDMSPGPSSLTVFHLSSASSYDPTTLGAIYLIDYTEDCTQPDLATTSLAVSSNLLVVQSGRRYAVTGPNYCYTAGWNTQLPRDALLATRFTLVDGPACGAGEACPDFSAGAAPLSFGYVRSTVSAAGAAAGSTLHGIDNWKVTVWRR